MAAPPVEIPCEPWTTPEEVRLCCNGLDPAYDLTVAIQFASAILYRLSGRQFPGECERTIWPCFPAGTMVTTIGGQRPIEDIEPGDVVLTHRGRWRKVTRSGQTGIEETFKLSGQGGSVSSTADHRFWSREIKPFNWSEREVKLGQPEWAEARSMVGNAWATPRSIETAELRVPLGTDPDDQSFWWMVGRWLGDGWVQGDLDNPNHNANSVFIRCGKHERDELASALATTDMRWKEREQKTTVRFHTQDGPLREWLTLNFGSGASEKDIPGWMFGAPEDVRRSFLAGYLSADGCERYQGKRVESRISTVSERMAISLRVLVTSLGFSSTLSRCKAPKGEIQGRSVSVKPSFTVGWFEGETKYTWTDNEHVWSRVKKMEASGLSVPVYDIEVEEDHSFLANGFAVHNCRGDNCGCCSGLWDSLVGSDWWWAFNNYPAYPVANGFGTGFVNIGRCSKKCHLPCIDLPATVNDIVAIWVDGVLLPATAYKIEAYRRVCRVDGQGWPCTNDLTGEPGDPGTWTITYDYGKPVPLEGRMAASIFACEIAKNRCGADNCLPQRLKQITRQDVTMSFADPLEFIAKGETGIYEVDIWLNSVNPSKLKRRSRVHRPDKRSGNTTFSG